MILEYWLSQQGQIPKNETKTMTFIIDTVLDQLNAILVGVYPLQYSLLAPDSSDPK